MDKILSLKAKIQKKQPNKTKRKNKPNKQTNFHTIASNPHLQTYRMAPLLWNAWKKNFTPLILQKIYV